MTGEEISNYIREIQRFVEAEKKIPSTSESESSDDTSCLDLRNPRRIVSSDDDDDYFVAKERRCRTLRVLTESSDEVTEENNFTSLNLRESHKTITSNCVEPKRKRKIKRRRQTNKVEETRRVDENIQRAKENFACRTTKAQGEWRKNRTFGISIDSRGTSTRDSNLPSKEDKEVEDVIRQAVGEPQCQDQPNPASSTETTNDRLSMEEGNRAAVTQINEYDLDVTRDSCYSPPPSSRWSFSSDSRSSISLSGDTPTGFRDTSTIPKSPWFKGKPPAAPKLEKNVAISCTRIEHFVRLPPLAAPFVDIDGEKFTIKPEQWLDINAPN